jgi:DNA-binding transcriptional regulator YhcF (GntR family)
MSKSEKIFVQDNGIITELTGADKEAFIAERKAENEIEQLKIKQLEELKELKISAYKKLGLTDEEINAII